MFFTESVDTEDDEKSTKVPNGSHGNHESRFNGANFNSNLFYGGMPPSVIPRGLNSFPTPSHGSSPEEAAAIARLSAAAGLLGSWPPFLGHQPGTNSNGCSSSSPFASPLFPGSSFPLFPSFGFNLMDFSALRSLPHSRSPPSDRIDKLPLDRPILDRAQIDRLSDRPSMNDRSSLERSPSSRSPIDRSPSEKLPLDRSSPDRSAVDKSPLQNPPLERQTRFDSLSRNWWRQQ